jgi:hypothetical protein
MTLARNCKAWVIGGFAVVGMLFVSTLAKADPVNNK